ncbi:MAG: potassium channel family protein [Myxococcota bacterium]
MLERRFTPLVLVLVLSMGPLELIEARWLEVAVRGGTLAAAAYALGRGTRKRLGVLLMLAPVLGLQLLDLGLSSASVRAASVGAAALFLGFVLWVVIVEVLGARRIEPDVLMGGIAIYLLFGYLFAMLFVLVEHFQPGSFSHVSSDELIVERLQYFSFVTLSSVGYGDISPVSLLARRIAVMEGVFGQLYLTVFVGRLVGYSFPETGVDERETPSMPAGHRSLES